MPGTSYLAHIYIDFVSINSDITDCLLRSFGEIESLYHVGPKKMAGPHDHTLYLYAVHFYVFAPVFVHRPHRSSTDIYLQKWTQGWLKGEGRQGDGPGSTE